MQINGQIPWVRAMRCGADSAFGNQAQCYNLLFCQTGLNTSNAQTCNTLKPRATQPGACVPVVLNGGLNPYYPVGSLEPIFVSCSPTTPSTCSGGSATSECNLLPGLLGNCVANPILPPNYCQPATGSALTPTTGQPSAPAGPSAPPHSAGPAS